MDLDSAYVYIFQEFIDSLQLSSAVTASTLFLCMFTID